MPRIHKRFRPPTRGIALAIDAVGGVQQLATRLGIDRQAIYQWQRIPTARVAQVAKATGIPPRLLRPDLDGIFTR